MRSKLIAIGLFFALTGSAHAKVYELDKDHTSVGFKIRHLLSNVKGQFKTFSGTCETDEKGALNKVTGVVKAGSIDTNNKNRDEHLRSPDFFDVKKFPELSFVSDKFKLKSGASGKIPGQLTIHGITKAVDMEVEYMGEAVDPWGSYRIGATGTIKIHRKDFGLTWNKALETGGVLVGDDVEIQIEVEAKEVKAASSKPAPAKVEKK